MTSSELLEKVKSIILESQDFVQKELKKKTDKQLSWRPNPGIWSVQDILAHINEYNKQYLETITEKIKETRFDTPSEDYKSSPLGKSAWKSMKLGKMNNVRRKYRSPRKVNPMYATELISGNEIPVFLESQDLFLRVLKKAKEVNLKKVKIPSSISKIIRLRLGDALLFLAYHQQRHIQQIKNLTTHHNFPRK